MELSVTDGRHDRDGDVWEINIGENPRLHDTVHTITLVWCHTRL